MKSVTALILLLAAVASAQEEEGTLVGALTTKQHGVKGNVYAVDKKTLLIKNFEYDGQGPDAFFWVGTSDLPEKVGTLLPYPFDGKFFKYDDQNAPVLTGRFDGTKDIKLTLPEDVDVTNLKWISVWCRQFSINFGDLVVPEGFSLEKATTVSTTTTTSSTTTTDIPPPLVHPSNTLDEEHEDDSDVQAEPESEPDHHDHHDGHHPRNGATSTLASSAAIFFLMSAKFLL
jgi:hypothetical protein